MEMTIGTWRLTLERIPPTPLELRRMYDAGAARWQQSIERLGYLQAYRTLFQTLQASLSPHLTEHAHVLDVGIGTGALSVALAQSCGNPFDLHGVDFSAGMLQHAAQTLQRVGLQGTLAQRDAGVLDFPDAMFDLVISAHLVEHLPNPPDALREMVRVLRPGAPLLLLVSQPGIWTNLIRLRWRYLAYPPPQVQQWMNEVGLGNLQSYPLPGRLPRRTSIAYLGFKAA